MSSVATALVLTLATPTQDLDWVEGVGNVVSGLSDITYDAAGNVYIATNVAGPSTFGLGQANETTVSANGVYDLLIAKYDATGSFLWARTAGGASIDYGVGIDLDAAGNIYVTGYYLSTSMTFGTGAQQQTLLGNGQTQMFLAKYDASGDLVWVKRAGNGSSAVSRDLAVDQVGNVFVVGITAAGTFGAGEPNETTLQVGAFLAKYDTNGQLLWAKNAGGDYGIAVTLDGAGNCYATGRFGFASPSSTFGAGDPLATVLTTDGGSDVFVAKYDSNGVIAWAKQAGGSYISESGADIVVDSAGCVYVAGSVQGVAVFGKGEPNETTLVTEIHGLGQFKNVNGFVAKFDAGGQVVWAKLNGFFCEGVALDTVGNVYAVGATKGTLTFGQGDPNETQITSAGKWDVCVTRHDQNGALVWARQAGGPQTDIGRGIALNGSDEIITIGSCQSPAVFDPGGPTEVTLTEPGGILFLAKYEAGDTTPPTADAGPDQSIHASQTVNLDGGSSFDDTTATVNLQFAWSFTAKPSGSTAILSDANTATPSFVADLPGTFRVELIVTDEAGNPSDPDEVIVSSLNVAPAAAAGDDEIVVVNDPAQLDGTASSDADGDPLTYAWTITSQPTGSTAVLSGANTATPSITPDLTGSYEIRLVVNDGFEDSVPDTVTLTVITGAEFAELKLQEASEFVNSLPNSAFDAPGHRNYFINQFSKIINFLQASDLVKAREHLEEVITRTDGVPLRNAVDPKGQGQAFAADFIVDAAAQVTLYDLLIAALNAI